MTILMYIKKAFMFVFELTWSGVSGHFKMAHQQISESKKTLAKLSLAFLFYILVPIGTVYFWAMVCIGIDQALYPVFPVSNELSNIELKNKPLADKSIAILSSIYIQLEKELDSFLGWAPNDRILCFFDSRSDRQRGVIHAAREWAHIVSVKTSKMGLGDKENQDMKKARQKKFAYDEDSWGIFGFVATPENYYPDGIRLVKKYQKDLKAGTAKSNITTSDIYDMLEVIIEEMLGEPYGRLTTRSLGTVVKEKDVRGKELKKIAKEDDAVGRGSVELTKKLAYHDLDDDVYYAIGAAIVSRDALVALFNSFSKQMSKGAEANMLVAINSLDAVINFNPWWVSRGFGDSMFADHRSKLSRYYTEAIRRIEDVKKSMKI